MHMYSVDDVMVTQSEVGTCTCIILSQHIIRVEEQYIKDIIESFINVQLCHQTMDVSRCWCVQINAVGSAGVALLLLVEVLAGVGSGAGGGPLAAGLLW